MIQIGKKLLGLRNTQKKIKKYFFSLKTKSQAVISYIAMMKKLHCNLEKPGKIERKTIIFVGVLSLGM